MPSLFHKLLQWCDSPYINHFLQPDTIIPSPASPQSWNRYSYVRNNPIRLVDPTGHAEDCGQDSDCKVQKTKDSLEKVFKVTIKGKWTENEIRNLQAAFWKMQNYLGGSKNLNAALVAAAKSHDANASGITVNRVAGPRWNSGTDASVAGWCGDNTDGKCDVNTIVVADDAFTRQYQFGPGFGNGRKSAGYSRQTFTNDLDTAIQFTFAHELVHVLSDANSASVTDYSASNSGQTEENMANEIALEVVTEGKSTTPFSIQAAQKYWNYP